MDRYTRGLLLTIRLHPLIVISCDRSRGCKTTVNNIINHSHIPISLQNPTTVRFETARP